MLWRLLRSLDDERRVSREALQFLQHTEAGHMLISELSPGAFLNRIGDARLKVLRNHVASDANVWLFLLKFNAASVVVLSDADTVSAITYFAYLLSGEADASLHLDAAGVAAILASVEIPEPAPVIPPAAPDLSGWTVRVGASSVIGTQIETQVAFDCDADASRSFAESFRHASEDDLIPQVRARVVAAKNPPAALVPDRVLVL
jgi:hypothetical protein